MVIERLVRINQHSIVERFRRIFASHRPEVFQKNDGRLIVTLLTH